MGQLGAKRTSIVFSNLLKLAQTKLVNSLKKQSKNEEIEQFI